MKKFRIILLALLLTAIGCKCTQATNPSGYPPAFQPYLIPFQNTDLYQIYNALSLSHCCDGGNCSFCDTIHKCTYNGAVDTVIYTVGTCPSFPLTARTDTVINALFTAGLVIGGVPIGATANDLFIGGNVHADTLFGVLSGAVGAWGITGNAGTNPATNLMGTTDNVNLNIARWGVSQIQLNRYTSLGPGHRHVWSFNVVDSLNQSMIRTYSNSSANIYSVQLGANDGQINGLSALFDVAGNQITLNDSILQQNGLFQLVDGTQGAGKILTSDASGNASWQANTGGGWGLTGNAGTNPTNNLIGTTDGAGLSIRAAGDSTQINFSGSHGNNINTYSNNFTCNSTDGNSHAFNVNYGSNSIPVVNIVGGILKYNDVNNTEGDGKVLTSDASGNASWQVPTVSGVSGSEPVSAYLGQFYFATDLVKMEFWNGSAWAIITSIP